MKTAQGQGRRDGDPDLWVDVAHYDELLGVFEELAEGAFFIVNSDHNVVAFGPGMEKITGISARDAVGTHCLASFRCERCLRKCNVFESGEVGPIEMNIFRADGEMVRVVKTARKVRSAAGKMLAVERVHVVGRGEEVDLRSPEQRLESLMESLGRAFVTADSELRIQHVSEQLATLVGCEPSDLLDTYLSEILGDQLFGQEAEFASEVLAGERKEGWRAFLVSRTGERISVSITAGPVTSVVSRDPVVGQAAPAALVVMVRPDPSGNVDSADEPIEFCRMVARSRGMWSIFRLIQQLHDNDARVLITGESGTGKELVARAIHDTSYRASGPFVVVNCGALPGDLLESELFGHVRGAFTGAIRDKPGRFELADGGTLFLDEIGDLPLQLQVKLLRVIQEGTFERVGDTVSRSADVRVLAATHVDLADAVANRRFRQDLYYRLRVVPIEVPPLRERREDIELLAARLLSRIGQRRGRSLRLSHATMRFLLSYGWPGNVRELENALEYATAICEGQTIHETDLPRELRESGALAPLAPTPGPATVAACWTAEPPTASAAMALPTHPDPPDMALSPIQLSERQRIVAALEATRYHRQEAADHLGMSRWTLWRKMKQFGLA